MTITLANLSTATLQEVFEQITRHLLTQNEKSNLEEICYYRHPINSKLRCAAGCLISDSEYVEYFETYSWFSLISEYKIPNKHETEIASLQQIHDRNMPCTWKDHLKDFGLIHNLDTTFMESLCFSAFP